LLSNNCISDSSHLFRPQHFVPIRRISLPPSVCTCVHTQTRTDHIPTKTQHVGLQELDEAQIDVLKLREKCSIAGVLVVCLCVCVYVVLCVCNTLQY
jgi:hypothetical protein